MIYHTETGAAAVNHYAFKTRVLHGVQWSGSCSDHNNFNNQWITARWTTVRTDMLLKNRKLLPLPGIKLWPPNRIRSAQWLRCVYSLHPRRSAVTFLNRGVSDFTGFFSLHHILFPVRLFPVLVLLPLLLRKLFYTKYLHRINKPFSILSMVLFINISNLTLPRVVLSGRQIEWIRLVGKT
jgi:hypothetical protein